MKMMTKLATFVYGAGAFNMLIGILGLLNHYGTLSAITLLNGFVFVIVAQLIRGKMKW